jgi:hypothetical protein
VTVYYRPKVTEGPPICAQGRCTVLGYLAEILGANPQIETPIAAEQPE